VLRESSKVVLIGVAEDRVIESFYKKYLAKHIPVLLGGAGITAVTAPNFSFFEDVPRAHTIYNRLRGLEGCRTVSPARNPGDTASERLGIGEPGPKC
jgi:hypothetical protein